MRLLRDTHVLSELSRERPEAAAMAQWERGDPALHGPSVVMHGLGYSIGRLPPGCRQQCLRSDRQGLRGIVRVYPDDAQAALWHGQQRARLEARGLRPAWADAQIAAVAATRKLVPLTRNSVNVAGFDDLEMLHRLSCA